MDKKQNKKDNSMRSGSAYIGLGVELVVPILLGVFIGHKIDGDTKDIPFWTLVLSLLGIVVGFYAFFKEIKKIEKFDEDNKE